MLHYLIAASTILACPPAEPPQALVAAHRGGVDGQHPENTLEAFRNAITVGARIIELDLRATRDGHVVVLHDARVDRTTDGRGPVHDLSLEEVRRLDAGNGARIPTLAEVLDEVATHDVDLLLDLKRAPGLSLPAVVDLIASEHDPARVIFGVRSTEDREALLATGRAPRLLGLVPSLGQIDAFLDSRMEAIRLWPGWLARHPELTRRIRDAGARVWATTGDADDAALVSLVDLGVDVLLTDRPAAAAALFTCR